MPQFRGLIEVLVPYSLLPAGDRSCHPADGGTIDPVVRRGQMEIARMVPHPPISPAYDAPLL